MQDSKRGTDVKNRLLDYMGEGEGGMIWENSPCFFNIISFNNFLFGNLQKKLQK